MSEFTLEALQAINDWQRGGDHRQKVKRGAKLKQVAAGLPARFRICSLTCYRQEAHEKDRIWLLLADDALPETIAAWTLDLSVAKAFKNGVPPDGLRGVIFRLAPPPNSVILNLAALYEDGAFQAAVDAHKHEIARFGDGIGRYGDTQREVVLELNSLNSATIYSYGGYASDRTTLAEQYFGRFPTEADLAQFDMLCHVANVSEGGEWWLSHTGTQNVLDRMSPHIERLKLLKTSSSSRASSDPTSHSGK